MIDWLGTNNPEIWNRGAQALATLATWMEVLSGIELVNSGWTN
jgi:hypothetical protein